jgi:hypothetical protein
MEDRDLSFTGLSEPHFAHVCDVDHVVCNSRTAHQVILIFENPAFGGVGPRLRPARAVGRKFLVSGLIPPGQYYA